MNRSLTLIKLLWLFVAMLFLNTSQAQTLEFQLSNNDSGGGDSIQVDIMVQNWDSIYSFQYTMRWDTAELSYLDVGNFNLPELDENSFGYVGTDDGFLITLWADLEVEGYQVADSTVIYSVFFSAPCGGFDTTAIDFSNMPISILASTLDTEFAPDTLSGGVNFVMLEADSFIVQNANCNGGTDGCIEIIPVGGMEPFSYMWSNGGTTQQACGLMAGAYTCTITDGGGCSAVSPSINVGEPAVLEVCANTVTDASCPGGTDGCIDLTICGGTGPYTYLWSPGGQTAEDICGLTAGLYTCMVTDTNNCTVTIMDIEVGEPDAISLMNYNIVNATCTTGGSIEIFIDGGTSPYTYLWSNGGTTSLIDDLIAGFYTCTVTDDNDCTFTTTALEVILENSDLSIDGFTQMNVSCFQGDDGSIDLDVSGSGTPFTYSWSNGASTQDISGLPADTYICTITDAGGCETVSESIIITEPATALVLDNISVDEITCFQADDACITINMTGGDAPYTYLWSNSGTTQQICGLAPGGYTCTLTDASGCTFESSEVAITEPPLLEVCAITTTDVTCNGGSDGCIDITPCGGAGSYTFLWSPGGQTDEDICDLAAGMYTCVITDANNCTGTIADVVVGEPGAINVSSSSIVNATCAQGGSVDITIDGGSSPYTYLWSNGETTEDISDLVAGFYTCVVTDDNDCTFTTMSFEVILENSDLTVDGFTQVNVSCFQGNDGSIDLDVSGTATPFSYNWSNGDSTQDIDNLPAGTYTCTITDANGCETISESIEITEPATALVLDNISVDEITCFQADDACITINMTGGVPAYTYLWSNTETTQQICSLEPGGYTCTVTDESGCTFVSNEVTINEPPLLEVCTSSTTEVTCAGGSDGCIDITSCGGTGAYTYLWTPGGQTDEDICNLPAGLYTCIITDANNCSTTIADIEVAEPVGMSLQTATVINATCAQGGSIDITIEGGSSPYTYMWSNGETTEDISDLVAGFYSCVVTDNESCTFTTADIEVVLENSDLAINTFSEVNVSCFGDNDGSIDLDVGGSATPFTYSWSNGAGTQDIDNLIAGTYTCTITDNNGCVITSPSIEITEPDVLEVVGETLNNVSCAGANDGSINIDIAGGTEPYMYDWSNGGTDATINDLPAGTYSCEVTDANDCVVQTLTYTIDEPSAIVLSSFELTAATCANDGNSGAINIDLQGGEPDYTYLWSNGAVTENISGLPADIYNCTVTDNTGCTFVTQTFTIDMDNGDLSLDGVASTDVNCIGGADGTITLDVSGTAMPIEFDWSNGATTQNLDNLLPGTYSCVITDGNDCTLTTSTITIGEPTTGMNVNNVSGQDASCSDSDDGSIALTVSGGTAPYTYLWSNGNTTEDIDGLSPDDYSCVITDDNGCTITTQTVTISAPEALSVELINLNDAACGQGGNNGSIDINVDGGTPLYTYMWSNGETTQDLTSIPAGDYTCTVTDLAMCTFVSPTYTIANEGSNLAYNGALTGNVNCFGDANGFVDIDVTGTATPLTYMWSNGATTEDLDGLEGGDYSCTITNANGCTTTTPLFTLTEPEFELDVTILAVNNTCTGTANGSISIEGTGGTAPYTYMWSNGATTAEITDLATGAYTCEVTDDNGCVISTPEIDIENIPSDLGITGEQVDNVSCFGAADGSIDLDVMGSATPLTFMWSNGAGTEDIDNLPPGDYSCIITDANGCTIESVIYLVDSPNLLEVELIAITNASCGQSGEGSIDISMDGGTLPYTYMWSNGATTEDLSNVPAGIYNCVITDANNCTLTTPDYDIINEDSDLSLDGTASGNIACFGDANGFINLDVSGTATPITFAWSNSATTQNLSDLEAGVYTCTITDAEGCTAITPAIEITEPDAALLAETVEVVASCAGNANGSVDIEVSGGTVPYTYDWSNGATTQDIDNLAEGTYSCIITDDNGCVYETEVFEIIEGSSDLAVASVELSTVTCFGYNDGAIDINPTGTATPFTYSWSNGGDTEDIDMLFAGDYVCTITDANGCIFVTAAYTVDEPEALDVCNVELVQPLCDGVADGCINISACGGTGAYTYLWSNGDQTPSPCNMEAGIYNCTITDMNGCVFVTPAYELETTADPMTLDGVETTNAACGQGNGGAIDITIGGGLMPYTYLWNNGETTEDLDDVLAGTYSCIVTDANGCIFETTSFLVENEGSDLMLTAISSDDIDCFGEETGSIDISVNGTGTPFTYNWSNGSMDEDIDNLPPGDYSCTVTDQIGCSIVILEVNISQPATAVTVETLQSQDVTCFGFDDGSIDLEVAGGVGGYLYNWSNGSMDQDLDNLPPGNYTCTITDANGCDLVSETITIVEPTAISLLNSQIVNETGGMSNGSISIEIDGGEEPYSYQWDDANMSTSQNLTNVPAGDYSCVITDANGCTAEYGVFIVQNTISVGGVEDPGFEVYPNPFEKVLTIVLEDIALDVQVVDVAGRLLYHDASPGVDLQQHLNLDLPSGVYVLKVQLKDGRVGLRKLVRQ